MRTARVAIFDWNGTLKQDLEADEFEFSLKITPVDGGVMGFKIFDLTGTDEDVRRFLDHYELEEETR